MRIYYDNTFIDVAVEDTSYCNRQIMGADELYLVFKYNGYLELPIGAYCEFNGTTYYLLKPEHFKKNGTRKFEYEVTLQSDAGRLGLYRFRHTVDGRLKFDMIAKASEFLAMLVANINQRNHGWSVGDCIDGGEKEMSFNMNTLAEVLDSIANTFDTEWSIVGKTISIGKKMLNTDAPLALSYGKGNGFLPGLGRSNYDNSMAFDILYVQGGSKNIDYSTYGNRTLLLPKSQTIRYDGEHFEGEDGFVLANSRQYVTDASGTSIRRNDKELSDLAPEDSYENEECYPKRVGEVSNWIVDDADKNFYSFSDSSIPAALDFNDVMIEGETMTVIFQSGMLAGREFEISKYDHATRTFEIVPAEIDGFIMPDSTFKAAVGDKYAIFGCTLPDAYICDNQSKTGASWEFFKECVRYMYDNEDARFTFDGVLDGRWAAASWNTISAKLVLCGVIAFSDTQFLQVAENIRIIGIKQYINKPHYPELTLSNTTVSSSIVTELNEYKAEPVLREKSVNDSVLYTKRRWRDIKETTDMLEDAFEHFSGSITPISVQTMQMLVGDESLQFRFVTSKVSPITVDSNFAVSFNGTTKILSVSGGLTAGAMILQHMTLGVSTLSSSHDASEYKFWNIGRYLSPALNDTDAAYYIYAKVAKNGSTGDIVMSQTAIGMEAVSGYYHLLLGILNSEYEGTRSFAPLFGYTEVLPGRITTDRICSADGVNYFDLLTGDFLMKLSDNSQYIKFSSAGVEIKGKLTIGAGSSGIENFAGYTDRQSEIDAAIAAVAGDLEEYEAAVELAIQDLQDQIDDNITSWYYEGVPTLSNSPASAWTTAELKQQHIGDLYYDKLTGFAYRFLLDGSTYKWVQIRDEAIAQALAAAAAAQDTADGKRTNYFGANAPTGVTLSIGDMWSNGETLKIWNGTAWVDSNTYASQAALTGLQESFDTAISNINAEMEEMEEAISRMNDDTVFDPSEKSYIRTLWENINGKASLLETGAGTYLQTKQLAEDCGADTGLATKLKFDGNPLYFDDEEITFWVIGLSQLDGAYMSLRDYLREVNLYLSQPTDGFDREYLADLFTTYYKAEQALVSYSANCYAESFCESTLQEFIDGEYATDLAEVQQQLDGKAETYYLPQNQDPSAAWTTTELKELHLGDIWMNTTPDANGNTHTYIYRKKNNAYGWEEVNGVPTDVFDMADGKASIYTAKPTAYKKNDMWILEGAYTLSGVAYAAGTIVVAKNDSNNGWAANDWTKKDKYTDDTALTTFLDGYSGTLSDIRTQIDKKAETWYQSTDPSTAWTDNDAKKEHVGDIWMDTSSNNGKKTYIYRNNGTAANPNYGWVAQDVPTEVFDKIDGKAAIYVTWNAWVVNNVSQLRVKDIFIPASETTQGGVTYKANAFYRCTSTNPVAFQELKYTDDAALTAFVQNTYGPFVEAIGAQVDAKADTFVQSTDPASAWTTNDLKDLHVGDMWLNTAKTTVAGVDSLKTAIYKKTGSTYAWSQTDIPSALFDQVDGKSSVYVAKPTSGYHARDLWILEQAYVLNGTAYRQGTILCATTTSQAFNAAHWVKKDAYIDSVDMDAALQDLESEISQMNATLSDINDDSVLDVTEKGYIRTLWEAINGLPSLSQIGDGSYMQTKNIIDTQGAFYESVVLLFHNKHLYFHDGSQGGAQFEFGFYYAGVAELDNAFYALRTFLQDVNLYSDVVSRAFSREDMASLFTNFYNAAQNVMQREIADAREQLAMIADDDYISAPEKRALVTLLSDEAQVYAELLTEKNKYSSVSAVATAWSAYHTAYNNFGTVILYYTAAATWEKNIPIQKSGTYDWDYIADYFAARKNLETALKNAMRSDYEYLMSALPEGTTTEMTDKLVLSTVLGVKNANNNVVAGMAGVVPDGFAIFPMLWAAGQSIAAVNEALWRVYNNGEQILGVYNGKRIRFVPDSGATNPNPRIEIYDANNAVATVFDGENVTDIGDIFGSDSSISLGVSSLGDSKSVDALSNRGQAIELTDSATFTTQKAGTLKMSSLSVSVSAAWDNLTRQGHMYIRLMVDGSLVLMAWGGDDSVDTSMSCSESASSASLYLSAGTHTISMICIAVVPNSAEGVFYASASAHFSSSATLEYSNKLTRFFGNGIAIGISNRNYLLSAIVNSKLLMRVEAGDAGIEINDDKIRIKVGNTWYYVKRTQSGSTYFLELSTSA